MIAPRAARNPDTTSSTCTRRSVFACTPPTNRHAAQTVDSKTQRSSRPAAKWSKQKCHKNKKQKSKKSPSPAANQKKNA